MTRDYYCSQKFDWLEIRLYDGFVASCCKAKPSRLTATSLAQDNLGYFNWPELIAEREMMLTNQRVPGCEAGCWRLEDQGVVSRRQQTLHQRYQHVRQAAPRTLNLVLTNTCSLTCSYCCKNFSSSWLQDILKHGDFPIEDQGDRYQATARDRVLWGMSQRDLDHAPIGDQIMQQIQQNIDGIEEVIITGGEPLLYAQLESVLEQLSSCKITLFTGLGVRESRLKSLLPALERHGVRVKVSAENTGAWHEFNRYGSRYQEFWENLALLQQHCSVEFWSVLSNLTVFDFHTFFQLHNQRSTITTDITAEPAFLALNVLDPQSRELVVQQLTDHCPDQVAQPIITAMNQPCDDQQRRNLQKFLQRFTSSRTLTMQLFPQTFIEWLEQ